MSGPGAGPHAVRDLLAWTSPGSVSTAYMNSFAPNQGIQGPIGSGKTTTSLKKLIYLACAQNPSKIDGIRYFKACVIHQNYRQLWRSTIKSWFKLVPRGWGRFTGGQDAPATHELRFRLPTGGIVHLIVDFIAIGDNAAEEVMRGYEPTVFFLNEADLLNEDVFTYAIGRTGRFPDMIHGGPRWHGVIMDFNAPEADSFLESRLINQVGDRFAYFCQPGGNDPGAENLPNLPADYYANQAIGQPEWYVDRMINNKLGFTRHGRVVWPEYSDRRHCAHNIILPVKGIPLRLAADAGGTPAGLVGQVLPNGQRRILDEIVCDENTFTGPKTFGKMVNLLLGSEKYRSFRVERATGDPSAGFGGDEDDRHWLASVSNVTRLPWRPAPTNALTPRFECVRRLFTTLIDGDTPAVLLSSTVPTLRKACANGYRTVKIRNPNVTIYRPEPEKNKWSHIAEALQYFELDVGEYSTFDGRDKRRGQSSFVQAHAITEDTPESEISALERGMRDEDYL